MNSCEIQPYVTERTATSIVAETRACEKVAGLVKADKEEAGLCAKLVEIKGLD